MWRSRGVVRLRGGCAMARRGSHTCSSVSRCGRPDAASSATGRPKVDHETVPAPTPAPEPSAEAPASDELLAAAGFAVVRGVSGGRFEAGWDALMRGWKRRARQTESAAIDRRRAAAARCTPSRRGRRLPASMPARARHSSMRCCVPQPRDIRISFYNAEIESIIQPESATNSISDVTSLGCQELRWNNLQHLTQRGPGWCRI